MELTLLSDLRRVKIALQSISTVAHPASTHVPIVRPRHSGKQSLLAFTVGLGGLHGEVLRDTRYRIAPVTFAEAQRMLRELRGYELPEGVHSATAAELEAPEEALVRLSGFAPDCTDERDINPLPVLERGAGVSGVDALIVRRASH